MIKKHFPTTLLFLFVLCSLSGSVLAVEKKHVSITQIVEHPALDAVRKGVKDVLDEKGWKEGKNLTWDYQSAQGSPSTAAQIAKKFAGDNSDVIVAIATPDNLFALDRAVMFFECHHIGHDLAGMGAVGQTVDHRHRRVFGHLEQCRFFEGPDHDQIDIAAKHASGVSDGFAVTQLHVTSRQYHGLATHLSHTDVKRNTRSGGWFFKDQRNHVIFKRLVIIQCAFGPAIARVFDGFGAVNHAPQISHVGCIDIQEMFHVVCP